MARIIVEQRDTDGALHAYEIGPNGDRIEIPADDSIVWDRPLFPSSPIDRIPYAMRLGPDEWVTNRMGG